MSHHVTFADFALRDMERADAPALLRHLNDIAVAGWLARPPYPYRDEDAEAYFAQDIHGWPARAAIDVEGTLVGMVSAAPHLGYWLAPDHWGRGIATRAAGAILAAHFAQTRTDGVTSGVFEGNAASARVLEKLGFRPAGRGMAFCPALGRDRVHIDYHLSRADWEARHAA